MSSFQNLMTAVAFIVKENMPDVFHVHTDLVGTARFEHTLHECHIPQALQHTVVGNGMLALVVRKDGHLHTVFGITAYVTDDCAFVLFHISPDKGAVTAFGGLVEKLKTEIGLGIRRLGNYQQTGCIFVDTVHKPHMRVVGIIIGNIFHVPGNGIDKRAAVVPVSGVHHQPCRFIDYHQVLVLIHYIQGNIFGNNLVLIAGTVHHHRYHIQRLHLVTALHRFAVRHHKSGVGSFLYTVARGIGQAVEQILVHTHHLLPLIHYYAEVLVKLRLVTYRFYIVQYIILYVVR